MLLFLLGCVKTSEPIAIEESVLYCDFETEKGSCTNQQVQLRGRSPDMVRNHPMMTTQVGGDTVQSYLDVEGYQFVILSDTEWSCQGEVEVTGLLQEYDMGGKEGTRASYRNYYVTQSKVRCLSEKPLKHK